MMILSQQLTSTAYTDEQKNTIITAITNEVLVQLGYKPVETKLISTTEVGRDNQQVSGFYSTQTSSAYVNDPYNNNNYQLLQTSATEAQRAMDAQNGSDFQQDKAYRDERSLYSQNFGSYVADYTDFALGQSDQGSLSTQTNQASIPTYITSIPSVLNNEVANNNNIEFAGLDKELGDNKPVYSVNGLFLGTTNTGIQGSFLVVNQKYFQQGMSDEDALKYRVQPVNDSTYHAMANHYVNLPYRPDWDGFVTIEEGIAWAKEHPGLGDGKTDQSIMKASPNNWLYLDASKLDFGTTTINDLSLGKNGYSVNLLYHTDFSSTASIDTTYALGRVDVNIVDKEKGIISIKNNNGTIYNWDKGGGIIRSTLINLERWRAGVDDQHGFPVFVYGTTVLDKPKELPNYVFAP